MSARVPFDDPILIGYDPKGQPIEWAFPQLNNFNGLFMGTSGSGKTYTIRHMVARVFQRGTTFHIIDVKGDFAYENFVSTGLGHYLRPEDFNDITFSYFEGGSSLNPLQVPRSVEGGGVVRTIENAKELVRYFNPKIGSKQIAYLGEVMKAVYTDFGILHDDESSWGKKAPTFEDVYEKLTMIYHCITSGLDSGSVGQIMNEIGRAKRKGVGMIRKAQDEGETDDQINVTMTDNAESVAEFIGAIVRDQMSYDSLKRNGTGEEWEHWSKDSVYGLRDTVGQMLESRLFTGVPSRTVEGKINRYDMTAISPAHQQIMMRIIASRVFAMGVMTTKVSGNFDPAYASHVMVADEGKHVKEISKGALTPVNRIATEGRGYGLGVWIGVQQPDQVTQDLLRNFSFYFLLKTPESSAKEMQRMFNLKPNQLKQLVARENCLYSSSQQYVAVNQFRED